MEFYFPVLRWKKGERDALANLKAEVKDKIAPITVVRINTNTGRQVALCWELLDYVKIQLTAEGIPTRTKNTASFGVASWEC